MNFTHPFRLACHLLREDFWKLVRLNLLLLLFSLPVVTLFPALAAGSVLLARLALERPVDLWPGFLGGLLPLFLAGFGRRASAGCILALRWRGA